MNEHCEEVLKDVMERIADLQSLANRLVEFGGLQRPATLNNQPVCPPPPPAPAARQKRKYARRKSAEPRTARRKVPARVKREPNYTVPFGQRGKLAGSIREIVAGLDGDFTRQSLSELLLKKDPSLEAKIGGLSVALIDMAERGELTRKGAGRDATYRRAKLKAANGAPSDKELA